MEFKNENEVLDELRRDADESVRLFSNQGQKELEKRVVRGFLRALGIDFLEEQLRYGQTEPIDICFLGARFQITERMDLGRRRNLEIKKVAERRQNARSLEDLLEPHISSRPLGPRLVSDLVLEETKRKWEKYRNGCRGVDMLVYINFKSYHLFPLSPWPDFTDFINFRKQGWRSVSVLMGWYATVLFTEMTAPDFLKSVVGQTRHEWQQPDGMFDP